MHIDTTPWMTFPSGASVPEHLFAVGDVHGHADLLEHLLVHLDGLPKRGAQHLIFTGDLNDRGPESLRAIHLAWDAKNRFEKRTYLPGNHEINLWDAMTHPHLNMAFRWWFKTYDGHTVCNEVDPKAEKDIDGLVEAITAALPEGFLDHIERARSHVVAGDLILVHAGIPPYGNREAFLALGILEDHPRGQHWAYIREPFLDFTAGWDPEGRGKTIVVHGHSVENETPLRTQDRLLNVVDRTQDRRRINLDTGAFAFGHLVGLEAHGEHYRFHVARRHRWID